MSSSSKRAISFHLHINTNLVETAGYALSLGCTFFQSFLISQKTQRHIEPTWQEREEFLKVRRQSLGDLYVHGSYWINLAAAGKNSGFYFLKKEILLAQALEFNYYVLHSGAATGCANKLEGIENCARRINAILKHCRTIEILLENTAHQGKSIGSDLNDFILLKERLDYPERISFCLDTAHAFAWGYDISNSLSLEEFFQLVASVLGFHSIKLIHLNDTLEPLGSKKDRHAVPGIGMIGALALKQWLHFEPLRAVPLIVEVPTLTYLQQKELLSLLEQWQQ